MGYRVRKFNPYQWKQLSYEVLSSSISSPCGPLLLQTRPDDREHDMVHLTEIYEGSSLEVEHLDSALLVGVVGAGHCLMIFAILPLLWKV